MRIHLLKACVYTELYTFPSSKLCITRIRSDLSKPMRYPLPSKNFPYSLWVTSLPFQDRYLPLDFSTEFPPSFYRP